MSNNIENRITRLLMELGVAPNVKGFHYLRRGIAMYISAVDEDPEIVRSIYGMVAEEFGTNRSSVERAMRHAVQTGWSRRCMELSDSVFGYCLQSSDDVPTNHLFISAAGEWLRKEQ